MDKNEQPIVQIPEFISILRDIRNVKYPEIVQINEGIQEAVDTAIDDSKESAITEVTGAGDIQVLRVTNTGNAAVVVVNDTKDDAIVDVNQARDDAINQIGTFSDLTDTPASMVANKWIKVNSAGDSLEYTDEPAGGGTSGSYVELKQEFAGDDIWGRCTFQCKTDAISIADGTQARLQIGGVDIPSKFQGRGTVVVRVDIGSGVETFGFETFFDENQWAWGTISAAFSAPPIQIVDDNDFLALKNVLGDDIVSEPVIILLEWFGKMP